MQKGIAARAQLVALAGVVGLLCACGADAAPDDNAGGSAGAAGVGGDATAGGSGSAGAGTAGAGTAGAGTAGSAGGPTVVNGCTIPAIPTYARTKINYKLPDPFLSMDGTRITQKDQWACRREEIGAQLQEYELGPLPPKSGTVTGSMNGASIDVTVQDAGKSITFNATIQLPTSGTAPYPALVGIGGSGLASHMPPGVAVITFDNDAMAVQTATSRGMGKFYDLYGADHPAGAMIAWTWGVSRLIDALETTPAAQIDTTHLAVTGCSRNGKGAIVAGAFENRFALVIPQESGTGGVGSWRVADWQSAQGQTVQTAAEIVSEAPWFRDSFVTFNASVFRLPYDHHMLLAMVAPRPLLVIENTSQIWLGAISTFTDSVEAHTVWEALGTPDLMGYSQVGNHNHCDFPASQQVDLDAYVKRFLLGDTSQDTAIAKSDGGFTVDTATWLDWTTPSLQ